MVALVDVRHGKSQLLGSFLMSSSTTTQVCGKVGYALLSQVWQRCHAFTVKVGVDVSFLRKLGNNHSCLGSVDDLL
jgi:hypothetical protein